MITVRHEHDDHFHIDIRHHGVVVDQPRDNGGEDLGPTPTELFVASLAACTAHYARRFLQRHAIPTEGLLVACDFDMSAEPPARVTQISVHVTLPASFPEERRDALQRVIDRCTVKNSLAMPPTVVTDVKIERKAA
ncbi:MAG TPA: OsmC family protein [Actinomycetota bacterium]|nr:OsmC family protein [Actinomycetota bacterium]